MDQPLRARRDAAEPVGVGVAGEEQRLIDEHRGVPHRRRTAEPRQRHPSDHRLDEEEQERAGEDGENEERAPGERVHAGRPIR